MDIFTSLCFHVFGSIPGCLYVSQHFLTEVTLPARVGLLSTGKQSLIHPWLILLSEGRLTASLPRFPFKGKRDSWVLYSGNHIAPFFSVVLRFLTTTNTLKYGDLIVQENSPLLFMEFCMSLNFFFSSIGKMKVWKDVSAGKWSLPSNLVTWVQFFEYTLYKKRIKFWLPHVLHTHVCTHIHTK